MRFGVTVAGAETTPPAGNDAPTDELIVGDVITVNRNAVRDDDGRANALTRKRVEKLKAQGKFEISSVSRERLAVLASKRASLGGSARGGIVLRMQGVDGRVPIGSVGDGMWRLLGLALALARARGGVLRVDEIDTGLRYTVMQKMWTMLAERSSSLDVQVFATTHSRDCYESLASVAESDAVPPGVLTIHRIEAGNGKSSVSLAEHEVAAVRRERP